MLYLRLCFAYWRGRQENIKFGRPKYIVNLFGGQTARREYQRCLDVIQTVPQLFQRGSRRKKMAGFITFILFLT